jgi:hypothetical protein
MSLIAPKPVLHRGEAGHTLLRRVLRVPGIGDGVQRIDLLNDDRWQLTLHDSGPAGSATMTSDRPTALHLVWAMDDASARITAGGESLHVAPGDMIVVPPGMPWSASAGLVLVAIGGRTERPAPPAVIGPTHGEETFDGYNRRTTYPAPRGLRIERWKVTQSLALSATASDYAILGLARPVALAWPGGTDLLGQGTVRVVPAGARPVTVLPDGLGYVLVIHRS